MPAVAWRADRARRGRSGALYPQSALAGPNSLPREAASGASAPVARETCSAALGLAVPTPTSPSAEMSIELVGAPGRMYHSLPNAARNASSLCAVRALPTIDRDMPLRRALALMQNSGAHLGLVLDERGSRLFDEIQRYALQLETAGEALTSRSPSTISSVTSSSAARPAPGRRAGS